MLQFWNFLLTNIKDFSTFLMNIILYQFSFIEIWGAFLWSHHYSNREQNVQFSNMEINEQPQKSKKKKKESCGVIPRIFRGVSKWSDLANYPGRFLLVHSVIFHSRLILLAVMSFITRIWHRFPLQILKILVGAIT